MSATWQGRQRWSRGTKRPSGRDLDWKTAPAIVPGSALPRTFLVSGQCGLDHGPLRQLLAAAPYCFQEVVFPGDASRPTLAELTPSNHVGLFLLEQAYAYRPSESLRYDSRADGVTSAVKNLLPACKSCIADKSELYRNLAALAPAAFVERHLAATWQLAEQQWRGLARPGDVFIVKPVGSRAGCGAGIQIVELTADRLAADIDEVERRRREAAATFGNAVLCRYVRQPMLWRGRKCHLRMYLLVRGPLHGSDDCHLEFWRQGKILTAHKPYTCAAYDDAGVHDSHGDTTDRNLLFPADLRDCHPAGVDVPPADGMLALEPAIVEQIDSFVPHLKAVLVAKMRSRRTGAPLWTYPESNFAYEVFGCDFLVDTADAGATVRLLEINDKVGFAPVFGPPDTFPKPWPPAEGPDIARWDLQPFQHSQPAFYQTMTDYVDFADRFWRWLMPVAVLPFFAQFTTNNNHDHINNNNHDSDVLAPSMKRART